MTLSQRLEVQIQHQEAVELTLNFVKEMMARIPALETALQSGMVHGISPAEDIRQFKAAIKALGYFTPAEAGFYTPSVQQLKAELTALTR
jgi:hypothetical protein